VSRALRAAVALAVLAAAVVITVVSVKAADGAFAGDYRLTGYFPRAGEGLNPGSAVVYRGVQVGRVTTIALDGRRAKVAMLLQPSFHVPVGTKATIDPVNLFGAEQVTLTEPSRPPETDLAPGGVLTRTATSDELGNLFTAAAPFLQKITRESLATVVGELALASNGEGPRIKASINAGASLADFFDRTLAAQLSALDSFSTFTAAIAPDGSPLNGLSRQENVALPAFNAESTDYSKLLASLTSFSTELARLLTDYHPTIDTLLSDGANPARVLTAQQAELGQVIQGAYRYAYKVATAKSQETLPTGSHFVYFDTFVMFSDVNALVCDLIAPPASGLSFLEPLQQALAGAGSAFTCKAQLAAFDAAQKTSAASAAPAVTAPAPGKTPISKATKTLGTAVYRILGRPSSTHDGSIGGYIGSLLGGSS
jgi:phospholipid/cholesterol/gamma-HCH transport system substrate-binding protein